MLIVAAFFAGMAVQRRFDILTSRKAAARDATNGTNRSGFMMSDESNELHQQSRINANSAAADVSVYNCHARLSPLDDGGWITARCCNLPEIQSRGKTQREALATLVAAFKAAITRYRTAGQPIPWKEDSAEPEPGEQDRWIAVQL
jgi:predicted RNase H-like HicB family nuclease